MSTFGEGMTAGLFGTISNAIGSGINFGLNKRTMREQNKFNAQQAYVQRQWLERQWHANNFWNSPANQKRLLVEAGYNPYMQGEMQAGQATSGSPSSASSVGALPANFSLGNDMASSLNQAFHDKRMANVAFEQQQREQNFTRPVVEANARYLDALGKGISIDNLNKPLQQRLQNEYLDAMRAYQDTARHGLYLQQTLQIPQTVANIIADTDLKISQNAINQLSVQEKQILLKYMDAEQLASIAVLISQRRYNDVQSSLAAVERDIKKEDLKRWQQTTSDWIRRTNSESRYWSSFYGLFPDADITQQRGSQDYQNKYNNDYMNWFDRKYPFVDSKIGAYRYGMPGSAVPIYRYTTPTNDTDYKDRRSWQNYVDWMYFR
jgi:hypothetical protein